MRAAAQCGAVQFKKFSCINLCGFFFVAVGGTLAWSEIK